MLSGGHAEKNIESAKDLSLDSRIIALDSLAWQWKLRLPKPLAGFMLFMEAVTQEVKSLGIKVRKGPAFHPYIEVAPLTLRIYAWQIMDYGQNEMIKQIRAILAKYTTELLASGLSDYPGSLKGHAKWWFKHFIYSEKYDDIAQEEVYTPGGSLISYARNVGAAVRKFSKLIGIDPKLMK